MSDRTALVERLEALKREYDALKPEECALVAFSAIQLAEDAIVAIATTPAEREAVRVLEDILAPWHGSLSSTGRAMAVVAKARHRLAALRAEGEGEGSR